MTICYMILSMTETVKRKRGRPPGSKQALTPERITTLLKRPSRLVLPMTDHQRIKEIKDLLLRGAGKNVAQKVIDIALNDDHPGQMVAIKMCLDRTLPISMFEQGKAQRSAVTINITGIGGDTTPITIEADE